MKLFKKNPVLIDLVHMYYNENKTLKDKLSASEKSRDIVLRFNAGLAARNLEYRDRLETMRKECSDNIAHMQQEIDALKNAKSLLQKSNEKLITENTALKTDTLSFSEKVAIDALPKQNQWLTEQLRVKTRLADKRALELGILERRIEELAREKKALHNELGAVIGPYSASCINNDTKSHEWEIERTPIGTHTRYTARELR